MTVPKAIKPSRWIHRWLNKLYGVIKPPSPGTENWKN